MILADVFRGDFGYDLLLFVHILAVVVGFGPTFIFPILSSQSLLPHVGPALLRITSFIVTPAILVAGVFGVLLSLVGPYGLGDGWVLVSLLVFIASFVFAMAVNAPNAKRLVSAATDGTGDYDTLSTATAKSSGILHLAFALLLILMVFKPGA